MRGTEGTTCHCVVQKTKFLDVFTMQIKNKTSHFYCWVQKENISYFHSNTHYLWRLISHCVCLIQKDVSLTWIGTSKWSFLVQKTFIVIAWYRWQIFSLSLHVSITEINICHCLAQRAQSSITGKELVIIV